MAETRSTLVWKASRKSCGIDILFNLPRRDDALGINYSLPWNVTIVKPRSWIGR
jgi:hypothetical protein